MVGIPQILDPTLMEIVKGILEAPPLDLYDEDSELSLESSIELVNERHDSREIGSANVFTAILLLMFVELEEHTVRQLSEEEIEAAGEIWDEVSLELKKQNFLRSKSEHMRDTLKLVVDNTQLIQAGITKELENEE